MKKHCFSRTSNRLNGNLKIPAPIIFLSIKALLHIPIVDTGMIAGR